MTRRPHPTDAPVPLPRCACGAEPVAIRPGRAAVVENVTEFDGGEADRGWCLGCWSAEFRVVASES